MLKSHKNISQMRTLCEQRNIPIISQNTETFLHKILDKHQPKVCLEIGSAVGYSTKIIANKISKRNSKLYSFEVSYPAYLEAIHYIHTLAKPNTTLYPYNFLKVDIHKIISPTEKIDFVFIDAQKSQYWNYMMKIRNLLDTSAIIIIDDVIKYHHKISSLYEFLQQMQIDYQIFQLDADDGVMLIQK